MPVIPRILVFAGSIRSGAFSASTADAAMKELAGQGADVTRISLADYPLPVIDQDLEREKGAPQNAVRLAHEKGFTSIAFALIGAGSGGFASMMLKVGLGAQEAVKKPFATRTSRR